MPVLLRLVGDGVSHLLSIDASPESCRLVGSNSVVLGSGTYARVSIRTITACKVSLVVEGVPLQSDINCTPKQDTLLGAFGFPADLEVGSSFSIMITVTLVVEKKYVKRASEIGKSKFVSPVDFSRPLSEIQPQTTTVAGSAKSFMITFLRLRNDLVEVKSI